MNYCTAMTHPLLHPLMRAKPLFANWLCVGHYGYAWWQTRRGSGKSWDVGGKREALSWFSLFQYGATFAIDLTTGAIHLQDAAGKITIVEQAEWEAED